MKIINTILIASICFALYSCAVQKAPLGGKKDIEPPKIDSLKSTLNFQTNFSEEKIILKFDEFVQLKNAFEQVVYSPPLKIKPEIVQRGKKITLNFSQEDTLRANTTYTINFGDAIQDLNESNILNNFRFVFSTGDVIDSLEISGNVIDDDLKKPAEEVLVLLYDILEDSIIYKEQPYYFAKTDKNGQFRIQNLRSDTFKVIVLKDGNLNLKYDDGEPMGFLDTFVVIKDSIPALDLHIFNPIPKLQLVDSEIKPYRIKFEFNRSPFDVTIKNSSDSVWWKKQESLDSIILWHDNTTVASDSFFLFADDILLDTVVYKIKGEKSEKLPLQPYRKNISRRNLLPASQMAEFEFRIPISTIDTSLFSFQDSLQIVNYSVKVDSAIISKLVVQYEYNYGDTLSLTLLPGALTFINSAINDTIQQTIIPDNPEKLGTIKLQIDSLDSELQYVMLLLDGENVIKKEIIENAETKSFIYKNMDPKTFSVKLILDINRNGKWDPGNYGLKTQSEEWKSFKLEALRENWELEAKLKWKE